MNADIFSQEFNELSIPLHGVRLPNFEVEGKYKQELGLKSEVSNVDFLRALCDQSDRLKKISDKAPYLKRLGYELEVINDLSFTDYILLVWSIINFCKENKIPTGAGRGSAAGSLVLYLIGVTHIDPIEHDLYFERFISKTRAKKQVIDGVTYLDGSLMCDVDMDICFANRHKVLEYLEQKYEGNTSKILTTSTYQGKMLIKECGKAVGGKSESEMNEISDLLPRIHGNVVPIDEVYYGKKSEDVELEKPPITGFVEWCDKNPKVFKTALKLRELIKNKGVHASGMILSHSKVLESLPLELSSDKSPISAYTMDWTQLTNLKVDILGVKSLTVVYDVCDQLGISLSDIDINDPLIYQNLYDLKSPHGIFQIEAETAYRALTKIKPKSLAELSGVLALARPGAMQFIDRYATFTNTGECESVHPYFNDVLGDTGGLCLYQEQMMKMANKIGFSLEESEIIRRVVGKKKVKEMAEWEAKIKKKIAEQKLSLEIGEVLWKILDDSKDYSFNKCLSPDTVVETPHGYKMMFEIRPGDQVKGYDKKKDIDIFVDVLAVHNNEKELFEVEMEDGRKIKCSMGHKFMCEDKKMRPLSEIISQDHAILCND